MNERSSIVGAVRPAVASQEVLRQVPRRLLPVWLAIVAVVLLIHDRDRRLDRELGQQRAEAAARLQASLMRAELETIASTTRFLAEDPAVAAFLSGDLERERLEDRFASFCATLDRYDQARLLNLTGHELARVDFIRGKVRVIPPELLQAKADRYYFREAMGLAPGELYLSSFDLNVEQGEVEVPWRPVLRLATPALDRSGDIAGVLVVNYLGSALLDRLERASADTCLTYLVEGRGYYLVGPDGERSWGFMFDEAPTFALDHPRAWEGLCAGTSMVETPHGLFVQAPIDGPSGRNDFDLRVVAFVPRDVLLAASRRSLVRLVSAGLLLGALVLFASWRLAFASAVRKWHEVRLERSESDLRRLSTQLLDAQEQERLRISRDLHDEVGQLATAVTIQLKRARGTTEESLKNQLLDKALEGTADLLRVMHRISASLRSSVLDDMGLTTALRAHLEPLRAGGTIEVRTQFDVTDDQVPARIGIHAFRTVQEALTNVQRHASADRVVLRTWIEENALHVRIEDDGRGFDPRRVDTARLGILGMRERVELLGGTFELRSEHGAGTVVHASFPLGQAAEPDAARAAS